MANFQREKDVLLKLVKAREAIKQKYNLLKYNKANTEKALQETFKPIIEPLNKIVTQNASSTTTPSFQRKRKLENSEIDVKKPKLYKMSDEMDLDDELNDTAAFNISYWNDHSHLDKTYGIRRKGNNLSLGDSKIQFENDYIKVQNTKFSVTPGLIELLYKKHPNRERITAEDMENYRQMLNITNAHKLRYKPDEKIRKSNSRKYTEFIAPMFKEGGSLPRYKIANKDTLVDYKYWDDPNELVDRLRLLIAERDAGNSSHNNEILAVIEELREGGYIY